MAYRIYIVPETTDAAGNRFPQLFVDTSLTTNPGSGGPGLIDYGAEPFFLVGADLDTVSDAAVTGSAGVQALPFDLDQNLSAGAVITVSAWMEARNIPADWLNTNYTYRQLVRVVAGFFIYLGRFSGIRGDVYRRLFTGGATLNNTINFLPAAVRTDLTNAADALHLDRTGITGSTTIRAALRQFGQQWLTRTVELGPGEV